VHIKPGSTAANLPYACYPVKRARFSAPVGASRRATAANRRLRPVAHPEGARGQSRGRGWLAHLDRSPGSLIRESRIFGQNGSFSTGMARHPRRTCASPVQVGVPRETFLSGRKGSASLSRSSAQKGEARDADDASLIVDWFPNSVAAADATRRLG